MRVRLPPPALFKPFLCGSDAATAAETGGVASKVARCRSVAVWRYSRRMRTTTLSWAGESYPLPVRMFEIVSEHLVVCIRGDRADRLHRKIECALTNSDGRGVNVAPSEAWPLRGALSLLHPPKGFLDAPFQRLLDALGGRLAPGEEVLHRVGVARAALASGTGPDVRRSPI
jgi:hypothetical protein